MIININEYKNKKNDVFGKNEWQKKELQNRGL